MWLCNRKPLKELSVALPKVLSYSYILSGDTQVARLVSGVKRREVVTKGVLLPKRAEIQLRTTFEIISQRLLFE